MSVKEFCEWLAYYNTEPWGSVIDGYRSASVAFTTANVAVALAGKKHGRRHKLEDFLVGVKTKRSSTIDTPEGIKDALMALANRNKRAK